jgi:hypothetical protein
MPACNSMGRIQAGAYDKVVGVVRQSASAFRYLTPEEMFIMVELLRRRQRDEISDNDLIKATPKKARKWIKEVLARVDKKFIIGILISVLLTMHGDTSRASSTRSIESQYAGSQQRVEKQIGGLQQEDQQLKQLIQELISRQKLHPEKKVSQPRAKRQPTTASPPATRPSAMICAGVEVTVNSNAVILEATVRREGHQTGLQYCCLKP